MKKSRFIKCRSTEINKTSTHTSSLPLKENIHSINLYDGGLGPLFRKEN